MSIEEKEKIKSLYSYLLEVNKNSKDILKNIEQEKWSFFLQNLPEHKSIKKNDFEGGEIFIEINKPNLLKPLYIEEELVEWITGDWKNYKSKIEIKLEKIIEVKKIDGISEEIVTEFLKISEDILEALKLRIEKRKEWVNEQKLIQKIRDIFDDFYIKYLELNKENENLEILLGNGLLKKELNNIYYPILLKKVKIDFEAESNKILLSYLEDQDTTILHTDFLNEEEVDLSGILDLKNKIKDISILKKDELESFLREFIHKLSKHGVYINDLENEQSLTKESFIIESNPLIFIRKREIGISKAIDEIIKDIEESENIPTQLSELAGIIKSYGGRDKVTMPAEDILFVKESNKEQIEIAQKIEQYNAVVVQGPPGTGKTHTIANLLGHFLAQGKNVLVTSHTKKALRVLKDKIPEKIQNLCISILDDDNSDMKRSVDGISENIGYLDSRKLKKEVEVLEAKRREGYSKLQEIKNKMYSIKYKENQSIIYNGQGFSIKEIGDYLTKNEEKLNKIKGEVTLGKPCPISNEEFRFLCNYRNKVTKEEEYEIKNGLTDLEFFKTKDEFKELLDKKNKTQNKFVEIIERKKFNFQENRLFIDEIEIVDLDKYKRFTCKDKLILPEIKDIEDWQLEIIFIGSTENGKKDLYKDLIKNIQDVYNIVDKNRKVYFDKRIEYDFIEISEGIKLLKTFKEALKNPGFLFKNNLKKAKESIKGKFYYNGKEIENDEECELVLQFLEIEEKKQNLKKRWDILIKMNEISKKEGDIFLEYAYAYINKLNYFLEWNNKEKQAFLENMKNAGLNLNYFLGNKRVEFPMEEIKLICSIANKLERIFKIIEIGMDLLEITKEYDTYNDLILKNLNESSVIESNISTAISNENYEEYAKWLEVLKDILEKKELFNKKEKILGKIQGVANDFYISLKTETFKEEIQDIYEVWKWTQLSKKIEELQKEPYEKLQEQLKQKNLELKKLTLQLVEKKSWYNVLCFIEREDNLTISQALRGWKQTIEKIGKGTGKNVEMYRRQAKEKISNCQKAVPIWIMPMNKVIDTLSPAKNKFDIVIIDEASQSDISSLVLLYMAKKIIIVGDDKQVSPLGIGQKIDKENALREKYLKDRISNYDLYDTKSSLYSIASTTYQPLMLREHFRCVPEIISYSNKTSYDYKIKPLRESNSSKLKPAVINYRVLGERNKSAKINVAEAEAIVSLIYACLEEDIYENVSFGIISLLGKEQVDVIQKLLVDKIGSSKIEKHNILCGDANHFQGDERDVIFLSMVDSNLNESGPLWKTGEGQEGSTKKRYNVAASRAKDQMWIVHSLDKLNDLKNDDIRRELLEFAENPKHFMLDGSVEKKSDSIFEEEVAKYLLARNYNVNQQWQVGAYRIDMVVSSGNKRVAIECDGEKWHSSEEQIKNDIERQEILERCGWEFIRIRGSKYFRDKNLTMENLIKELEKREIYPEKKEALLKKEDTNIIDRIKNRSLELLEEWKKDYEKDELDKVSLELEENKENEIVQKPLLEVSIDIKQKQLNLLFQKEENTKEDLHKFLTNQQIEYIDHSKSSGWLWIIYAPDKEGKVETFLQTQNYKYTFDKRGAKATKDRKAWRVQMKEV